MNAIETKAPLLNAALEATCESTTIDFKATLDVDNKGDWLEVIKDLVAMSNSGGGIILFGVDDSANPTGANVAAIIDYDASRIGDKVRKYTGVPFGDFTLGPAQRGTNRIAVIQVSASQTPLAFTADGQYTNEHGQERFAFRQGTFYFRHGAKSEPGTTSDLRAFVERELERIKDSWLRGIRQVVEAPPGAVVSVGLPLQVSGERAANRVRLADMREITVDSIRKHTQGFVELSDLTGHKPPLVHKKRAKGGRTYEVLTPLERFDGLREMLRGSGGNSEQLALLDATDNTPVIFGPKLVDVVHLLAANAEQGERLDHLVERFRGQREQIRATFQYLKQNAPNRWAKTCDKLLPFYDDLFAQTAQKGAP